MEILKRLVNKFLNIGSREHEPDYFLVATIAALVFLGLVMLSSVSSVVSFYKFGDSYYYFRHQLFGLAIGLLLFWYFSRKDYHTWRPFSFVFLICSIALLLLVFIPGLSAHYGKARSWINIFGFSLQPSELVKLSLLFYLAAWLEKREKELHETSRGIAPFVFLLGSVAILMILQPDIGTLSIIAVTSLAVYFVGGGRISHITAVVAVGLLLLLLLVYAKPYQRNRFKCMMDTSWSSSDICYQVHQSLIAVGSGGWLGRGLGYSRQKFMYLPEVNGDSIFAIMAEELGFIFSTLFFALYLVLFYRGAKIAKAAPDRYGKMLAFGIVVWFAVQSILNIGGMIALVPMTGVPLPLVSYGGTAIMVALAALGVLVNISKHTKVFENKKRF